MPVPPFRTLPAFPILARPIVGPPLLATPIAPRAAPVAPVVVPAVPLDPARAQRARFDALIAELQQLRGEMNRAVHRCGTILRELSEPGMLAIGGVSDFGKLLEQYDLPSRFTADKYVAVAEHFTADEAARIGVERGYAIVRGAALLPTPVAPRALLAQNPIIAFGPMRARLDVASMRGVLGWVKTLETPAPTLGKRVFRDADSARDKLERRLVATGVGKLPMRVHRRGDRYLVRIELEVDQTTALAAALRKST